MTQRLRGPRTALETLTLFVRRWRLVAGIPLASVLTGILLSFLMPKTWVSTVAFVPGSTSSVNLPALLGGLAGQFGIRLPGERPAESPQFYRSLLQSREVLDSALLTRYLRVGASPIPALLVDVLEIHGRSIEERLEKGRKALRGHLVIAIDAETGIVRLGVKMPDPVLAAAVAQRLYTRLDEFNRSTRQTAARARREFLDDRVAEARQELTTAEDALRAFLTKNRLYRDSPDLVFDYGRLERQVQLLQQLYLTLASERETARLEEIDNTPVLTVVERPQVPVQASWPRPVLLGAALGLLGAVAAALIIASGLYRERLRAEQPDAYAELTDAVRELGRRLPVPRRAS